jgi:hypothetical protein
MVLKPRPNRSTKELGLVVREELPNDGAKWGLAVGEWVAVAYFGDGEKQQNGRKLPPASHFLGVGEGEGWSWSRRSVIAGRWLTGAAGPWHTSSPLSWVTDRWASVGVFKGGVSPNLHLGHTVHNPTR